MASGLLLTLTLAALKRTRYGRCQYLLKRVFFLWYHYPVARLHPLAKSSAIERRSTSTSTLGCLWFSLHRVPVLLLLAESMSSTAPKEVPSTGPASRRIVAYVMSRQHSVKTGLYTITLTKNLARPKPRGAGWCLLSCMKARNQMRRLEGSSFHWFIVNVFTIFQL